MAIAQITLAPPIEREEPCRICGGHSYFLWWETEERTALQCSDGDCRVFFIPEKPEREVFEV